MKKKSAIKLKGFKIIAVVGAGIAIMLATAGCFWRGNSCWSYFYEQRYGISLPRNMEMLFNYSSLGWFGEGSSYTVFQLSENIANFDSIFEGVEFDIRYRNREEFIDGFRRFIGRRYENIPEEFRPDFEKEFYWGPQYATGLRIMYFPCKKWLIVSLTSHG